MVAIGFRSLIQFSLLGVALLWDGPSGEQTEKPRQEALDSARTQLLLDATRAQQGKAEQFLLQVAEAQEKPFNVVLDLVQPNTDGSGLALVVADEALRGQLSLPEGQGLVVTAVTPDGPAARSGVAQNDILLFLADKPLGKPEDLNATLKAAGDKAVELKILRAGKPLSLKVRPQYRVTLARVEDERPSYYIGVQASAIDETLRSHLDIPADQGLIVSELVENSPAAKAGFKKNDILLSAGDTPLTAVETLVAQVQSHGGKPLTFKILRGGKPNSVEVTPEKRPQPPQAEGEQFTGRLHERKALESWLTQRNATQNDLNSAYWVLTQPQNVSQNLAQHLNQNLSRAAAAPPQSTDRLEKRLEELSKQIDGLRNSVDELRKAIKSR